MIPTLLCSLLCSLCAAPRQGTAHAAPPAALEPPAPGAVPNGLATPFGAAAPAPASAAPPPRQAAALLDSIQLIVNERCITIGDLQRMGAQQAKPPSTTAEFMRMLEESAEQLTRHSLLEQAGKDLGYDEAMVRTLVRQQLERHKEDAGGVAALAQELQRASLDSQWLKEDAEQRIYRQLFQLAVTGNAQGPGGRVYVDRYVRPGLMLLEFRRKGSSLDLPSKVLLEEMILAPALGEAPESARTKAQLVRRRLLDGEDFYELNATFGLPGRDPELAPIEEAKLALAPEVKSFVDGAAPGDVSELLPILRAGQLAGFRLLRFVGRQEGRAASFVDREFQDQIAASIQERRDKANLDRALRTLLDAAYVWPPDVGAKAGRPPAQAQPQDVGEPLSPDAAAPAGPPAPEIAPQG